MDVSNESTRPLKKRCSDEFNLRNPQFIQKCYKPNLPTMPTEIIVMISKDLPESSRASLALTCHALLDKQGTDILSLDKDDPERYALLELLEKDGRYPSQILCPDCKRFHRPAAPVHLLTNSSPNEYTGCRVARVQGTANKLCEATCVAMQCIVSRDMVAAHLRAFRLRANLYRDILCNNTYFAHSDIPPTAIRRNVESRICLGEDGQRPTVVLRIQMKFSTGLPAGPQALAAAPILRHILHANPILENLCPHTRWTMTYDFIPRGQPNDVVMSSPRHICLWSHPVYCSTPACGWVPAALAQRWSCVACATDFAAARVDETVDDNGNTIRFFVLTVWQSLGDGTGLPGGDWMNRLGNNLRGAVRPRDSYGSSRAAFEKTDGIRNGRTQLY